MKVVILAGGYGTRLSEETELRPKPMVEIGGKPILWHIMKIYSHYGFNEFIVCCGYKSYYIKDYFYHYYMHSADITIDLADNKIEYHNSMSEPWKITLVDTGYETMTGGRIKRIQKYIGSEPFMLTYGDGVANINIAELLEYHKKNRRLATLTAVLPTGKFGALEIAEDDRILSFIEKPHGDGSWVNGGFFVLQPEVFEYITEEDATVFERKPLENLAREGQLQSYKHSGFWKPMDTLRDKIELQALWETGNAPWKVWRE
ncbi:glucose-1-phosphate cytidylyltransferase [Leadbettera azotonutricia]|uniref:Glucose-1-phosphate cytidylyltransferase n=1 Tax=Leadbettera azotonutricia (strain ATCC BAA-888 / DSM 13862 / ZAS-9) TaxID=545695 RepID=F5YB17_LEAAZ|nr:glucose-1-phosphate cytidylyltransferase [Leadbettera azotonutricia]AEF82575.1 glucose-1-phosphate cytidylyltransferase [Leadbettera azotonutricia ZAS-9]